MAGIKMSQKKQFAQILYTKEHLTQKEIAERVGVTPVTVNRWVKKDKWDELRVSLTMTREEQIKALYKQLSELNKSISQREEGERYASAAEADTINKITTSINKLETETGLGEIISSFKGFLSWLRQFDLQYAQQITPLFDDYVKTKLS